MRMFRNRLAGWLAGSAFSLVPAVALAEGAGGGYRGIAQMYFTLIMVILIYGIHDVFHNRKITLAAVVILPIIVYGFLLPKS
jgi:hypothetical protein